MDKGSPSDHVECIEPCNKLDIFSESGHQNNSKDYHLKCLEESHQKTSSKELQTLSDADDQISSSCEEVISDNDDIASTTCDYSSCSDGERSTLTGRGSQTCSDCDSSISSDCDCLKCLLCNLPLPSDSLHLIFSDFNHQLSSDPQQCVSSNAESNVSSDPEHHVFSDLEPPVLSDPENNVLLDLEHHVSSYPNPPVLSDPEHHVSSDPEQVSSDPEPHVLANPKQHVSSDPEHYDSSESYYQLSLDPHKHVLPDNDTQLFFSDVNQTTSESDTPLDMNQINYKQDSGNNVQKEKSNAHFVIKKSIPDEANAFSLSAFCNTLEELHRTYCELHKYFRVLLTVHDHLSLYPDLTLESDSWSASSFRDVGESINRIKKTLKDCCDDYHTLVHMSPSRLTSEVVLEDRAVKLLEASEYRLNNVRRLLRSSLLNIRIFYSMLPLSVPAYLFIAGFGRIFSR